MSFQINSFWSPLPSTYIYIYIYINYPTKLVEDQVERAKKKHRKALIFQERRNKKNQNDKVRLMFTYNKDNPPIHKWVRESKKLLARNDDAKALGESIQIGSRQPKNLQRLIGGYRKAEGIKPPVPDRGCVKCGRCRVSCPILNETKTFQSTNTGKTYPIRQKLSCQSNWLIYLATCKHCRGQYVGKSQTVFKLRHSNHKQEIKRQVGGLGHHYGGSGPCSYQDLSITLIEQIEEESSEILAERELHWQHQLRVYVQNGYNAHYYRKDLKK
jgi:hypothetical protein